MIERRKIKMTLTDLITELQSIADRFGDCSVQVANDNTSILDAWEIDRVCFFKDGETQIAIIVEE